MPATSRCPARFCVRPRPASRYVRASGQVWCSAMPCIQPHPGIPSRSGEGYKSEGGLFRKLEPVRIFILPRLGAAAAAGAAAFLLDGNVHDEAAGGGTERIGDFEPGDLGAIAFKIVFTADSDTVFPRQEVVFDVIFASSNCMIHRWVHWTGSVSWIPEGMLHQSAVAEVEPYLLK